MRLGYTAVILWGLSSPIFAQALPDSLRGCSAESDSQKRLACYDKAVGRVTPPKSASDTAPVAPVTSAAPAPAAPVSTPAASVPGGEFGLDADRLRQLKAQAGAAESQSLTAHITAISQLPYGRQRISLDNVQVWEQTEEDWGFNPRVGAAVTITRGALGGFWMAADAYKKIRVKRIR